jgi:hypothetical protein
LISVELDAFLSNVRGVNVTGEIARTRKIVGLLRQTTSLPVVSKFLETKGSAHSAGSWDLMLEKRIIPGIELHLFKNDDLLQLLRAAEECGRQHVFLQKCKTEARCAQLMDRTSVTAVLKAMKQEKILSSPLILEQPAQPTIVDVRWETASVDLSITIKLVELRKTKRFIEDRQYPDGTLHRIYGDENLRVVHVAKLHRRGLLELRIASQESSSRYEAEVHRIWKHFEPFFPSEDFLDLSITKAKSKIWTDRQTLADIIRYTNTTVRNDAGNIIQAISGSGTTDLGTDAAFGDGLDHAMQHDTSARCEAANIWFKKTDQLSMAVHVLLSGESNEFAIPANCTEEDYKYVLNKIVSLNR